jgi:serine/threonine protein kinase
MKPSTVFLDTESTTSFPLYPKPILADFGCCLIKQSPDDVPIATYADGQGTPGYLAPETVPRYDRATGAPSPLASQGSWTNVFGAGAIISRIMTRTVTPKGPTYESGFEEYDWLEGGNATSIYSEELCQLVRRCVRYRPDERITAAQLRRKIRKYSGLQGDDDEYVDLTDGMRTKTVENDPRLLLSFKKDGEYTQGFAL